MEKKLLDMKDISKTFGSVQALKGVSLDLYAGEVLALMGENGAGKSTLMNILSGSLQPTEGEIYLKGEKVHVSDPITAKKLGIAKIHQELQIVPELSVAENIFLGRWKSKAGPAVDFKGMIEESRKYLEMLDVKVDPAKKLKDLRIGEQQLVEIAKAISLNSEIIVMDEPTRGIDIGAKAEIYQLINNLAKQGMAIIVVSSELPEVIGISDRIVTFCEGELTGEFLQKDATQEKLLESATK